MTEKKLNKLGEYKQFKTSVLFIGDIGPAWWNSTKHWEILVEICSKADNINLANIGDINQRRWLRRIDGNVFTNKNIDLANNLIIDAVARLKPEIVWFEKPLIVTSKTLKLVKDISPESYLVCRQDDNPFGARGFEKDFWKSFKESIPFYDLHYVKRDCDFINFNLHGAKKISYFWSGYDARDFFCSTSDIERKKNLDYLFVGTNIDDRSSFFWSLQKILKTRNFYISGQRWSRSTLRFKYPENINPGIISDSDLRILIQSSHASLGLFSTSNNDEFSGRAFQIAAAGGVLVAPRSKMHNFFFRENEEAFFFDDVRECAEIIKYVIENPSLSLKLGLKAAQRAKKSGYSLQDRIYNCVNDILSRIK